MKITAQEFSRLLPALQHLARFPHANRPKICVERQLETAEVEAALASFGARISDGRLWGWDEETLAVIAEELKVPVGDYKPEPLKSQPPSRPLPSAPVTTSERSSDNHAAAATKRPLKRSAAAVKTKDTAAAAGKRHRTDPATFRIVCLHLLDHPEVTEVDARRAAQVSASAWTDFKKKTFGLGKISREKLEKFVKISEPPQSAPEAQVPRIQRSDVERIVKARPPAIQPVSVKATRVIGSFSLEIELRLVPVV